MESWVPGATLIRTYRREWLSSDVAAGLSIAAVALPIGIAYAQLAGFPPVAGIYSCILPPLAYAIFGSSRQLVVNPDAASCAIVAATVAPLAMGNPERYTDLAIALTFLTGLLCIAGGLAHLGVVANFLSRPILTGYLNGIALSIIAGQLGTLLGFSIPSAGFFRTIIQAASRLRETHTLTLIIGLSLILVLRATKHLSPRIPAPLLAAMLGIGAVYLLGLDRHGVILVGSIPAGFPTPRIPRVSTGELGLLAWAAAGIVLVSFCSMMTTARGFAAKNGYTIDVNHDMIALGIADLASGFNRGFVVSGADSRTAVADSAGGKTQVASVVAAAAMAAVLLFLTRPLAYLPTAALAAILISAALGLFDIASLRTYYNVSRPEFRHSVVAMLGVMTVGVLPGVLIAVGLALLKLLLLASRPHDVVLRPVKREDGSFSAEKIGDQGEAICGMVIYRFDSSLLFFNADYFKARVRTVIAEEHSRPRQLLIDTEAIPLMDITGAEAMDSIRSELARQGIVLSVARAKGLFRLMLERTNLAERIGREHLFPSVRDGIQAFLERPPKVTASRKEEALAAARHV
jgi:high affinity sulfate transporter 1